MKRFAVDIAGTHSAPRHVEAPCADEAARRVLHEGLMPIAVRELPGAASAGWRAAPSETALAMLARQLAQLLAAGMPMEDALGLMSRSGVGAVAALSERLLQRVREGAAISDALEEARAVSATMLGIVRGAEQSGDLARGFAAAADLIERRLQIRRAMLGALSYPALLLAVSGLVMLFMLSVVIPEFAPLFEGEEARLPWVTRATLVASALVAGQVWLIALVALLAGVMLRAAFRTRLGRIGHRLPLARELGLLQAASVLEVLGSLMQHGVDASEAMRLTAQAARGTLLEAAFNEGERRLREGDSLTRIVGGVSALPETTRSLIAVGEASGEVGHAVVSAARLLEQDTQHRINRLLAIINPAAVLTMGAVVAVLVAGIMLGILGINQLVLK